MVFFVVERHEDRLNLFLLRINASKFCLIAILATMTDTMQVSIVIILGRGDIHQG
jgi:hypothetical protein